MSEEQRDDKVGDDPRRKIVFDWVEEAAKDESRRWEECVDELLSSLDRVAPSAVAECKAKPHSYGGGASQEQRWQCDECGDVTDSERCPKGRVDGTLASLAMPSAKLPPIPTKLTPRNDFNKYQAGYHDGWNECVDAMLRTSDSRTPTDG